MDERDDVSLTAEHAQTWMLLLLRAGALAGFNPMPSEIFHRLVFLSNAVARVYDAVPPTEFVLKHERGPYYPRAQFDFERLAVQGLADVTSLEWTASKSGSMCRVELSLSDAGRAMIQDVCDKVAWARETNVFLEDLCSAFAQVREGAELSVVNHDLTYGQERSGASAVIAFNKPDERLSVRATDEIADSMPETMRPNRQNQLRLYMKYIEQLAA